MTEHPVFGKLKHKPDDERWIGFAKLPLFAAVGALSAWAGGSIPEPGLREPVWIEGFYAFLKLGAVAALTRMASQHFGQRPPT